MTGRIFIAGGKRTPFGSFGGGLSSINPVDLSVHCSKVLMEELKIDSKVLEHVILGNVIPSSPDTLYGGRHLALKIGAPIETPGYVVNRLCGSGIQIISDAYKMIQQKEASCVLASGVENMSMTPHLVYGTRFGTKFGQLKNVDMLWDALVDKYTQVSMGQTAENLSKKFSISREESDEYSLNSHKKVLQAYKDNLLQDEIAPIELKKNICSKDEHFREDISIDSLKKLRPSFSKDGIVTPGSASGIVDGASSVLVADEDFCNKNNLDCSIEIIDFNVVGVDPSMMGIGPSLSIQNLLKKNKLILSDIDLFEINEAFSSQVLSCVKDLDLDVNRLNIWGGAIALGHPLAASGTRITWALARQLKHYDKEFGIASACIGGGQGISILLKRIK